MRALIQRVIESAVIIEQQEYARIGQGLLILLGIEETDTPDDAKWMMSKIAQMRIFSDENGKMNRSVQDISGECLLVSQFTLFASTKKGNRPSFIRAARPEKAIPLYTICQDELQQAIGKPIQCGVFGADMKIALINDGPVTIWIDSQQKE